MLLFRHLSPLLFLLPPLSVEAAEKITYDAHIHPLFESKCFSCHNPDKTKGGLDLTTYTSTMAGGSSGPSLSAGAPEDSYLFSLVTHAEEPEMPPKGGKLPSETLERIAHWIEGGLLETSSSIVKKPKAPLLAMAPDAILGEKPAGPPPMPESLSLEPEVVTARANAIASLAMSPWAPLLAVTGQKQVLLYHSHSLDLLGVLPYPEGFPLSVAFSRNGHLLFASGGRPAKSGNVVAWDIKTGKRVLEVGAETDAIIATDVHPSQSRVAIGTTGKKVKLFDASTGSLISVIEKHTDWVMAVAFSPDGKFLATGDRNGGLLVWEAETGNEVYLLDGHKDSVTALAWRADGKVLASSGEDGKTALWEMTEGKRLKQWDAHKKGALAVTFNKTGQILTTGRDRTVKLWDQNGKQRKVLFKANALPLEVGFDHAGKQAVIGSWEGALHLIDIDSGDLLKTTTVNPPAIASRIKKIKTKLAEQLQNTTAAAPSSSALKEQKHYWQAALTQSQLWKERRQLEKEQADFAALSTAFTAIGKAIHEKQTTISHALTQLSHPRDGQQVTEIASLLKHASDISKTHPKAALKKSAEVRKKINALERTAKATIAYLEDFQRQLTAETEAAKFLRTELGDSIRQQHELANSVLQRTEKIASLEAKLTRD